MKKASFNKIPIMLGLFLSVFLIACEEDITLKYGQYDSKMVVEGSIFSNEYARVILTRSRGYFEPVDLRDSTLIELFGISVYVPTYLYNTLILDAQVVVTDGTIYDTLQLVPDFNVFPYLKYIGTKIKGENGKSYQLIVEHEEQEFIAHTSIPYPVPIDTLWFETASEEEYSPGFLRGRFSDPIGERNYYRIFTKTLGRDSVFVQPWFSIWDDTGVDGKDSIEFRIFHGDNRMEDPENPDRFYFLQGEKVIVRMCSIDLPHYRFWFTYQQNAGGGGNPFANPAPIEGNVPNALGNWGGYGVYEVHFKIDSIPIDNPILKRP